MIWLLWMRKKMICIQIWEEKDVNDPLLVTCRFVKPLRTIHGARPRLSCQRSLTWPLMWWRLLRSWAWCGNAWTTAARTGGTFTRWPHERVLSDSAAQNIYKSSLCTCFTSFFSLTKASAVYLASLWPLISHHHFPPFTFLLFDDWLRLTSVVWNETPFQL